MPECPISYNAPYDGNIQNDVKPKLIQDDSEATVLGIFDSKT